MHVLLARCVSTGKVDQLALYFLMMITFGSVCCLFGRVILEDCRRCGGGHRRRRRTAYHPTFSYLSLSLCPAAPHRRPRTRNSNCSLARLTRPTPIRRSARCRFSFPFSFSLVCSCAAERENQPVPNSCRYIEPGELKYGTAL